MNVANTMAIRLQNALNIINELECNAEITNTEIAHKRNLSIPTISNIVNILKSSNIVMTAGTGESSGGRKPNYLTLNPDHQDHIGVSIAKHTVYLLHIDFAGHICEKEKYYIQFRDDDTYWSEINDLIRKMQPHKDSLCDIGIALPGFVDLEEKIVSGTDTLGVSTVSLENIYKTIGEHVVVDDSCSLAAKAQIFGKQYVDDSFFVLLSRRVSGTLIYDRSIFKFKTSSIDIGAMLIDPVNENAESTFYELCSASRIIDYLKLNNYSVSYYEEFFEEMQNGNIEFEKLWDDYLRKLAIALYNIYSIFKVNVVIGGEMAKYIAPYTQKLNDYVNALHLEHMQSARIQCSGYGEYDDAYGAALEARANFMRKELPEILKNAASVTPQRVTKKKNR